MGGRDSGSFDKPSAVDACRSSRDGRPGRVSRLGRWLYRDVRSIHNDKGFGNPWRWLEVNPHDAVGYIRNYPWSQFI